MSFFSYTAGPIVLNCNLPFAAFVLFLLFDCYLCLFPLARIIEKKVHFWLPWMTLRISSLLHLGYQPILLLIPQAQVKDVKIFQVSSTRSEKPPQKKIVPRVSSTLPRILSIHALKLDILHGRAQRESPRSVPDAT